MKPTSKTKKLFKRHFRIYFKNNHPAYIIDEEGNKYVFHRVTHSKTSGGKKTWIKSNPFKGDYRPMRIVKQEQKDSKARFSLFTIELKSGVDISYPEIKKVGKIPDTGNYNTNNSKSQNKSSAFIKTKMRRNHKKNKNKKRHEWK